MSDVLRKLGLDPEADEHPANAEVLGKLGLKPEADEHPSQVMVGSRVSPDWERTPGARDPNPAPEPSTLHDVRVATDPFRLGTAAIRNYGENAAQPAAMMGQGVGETLSGQPASGLGHVALGGLGMLGAGVQTAVTDPLTQLTGNPDFAERASMFVPMNVGGKTASGVSAVTNAVKPTTRALDMVAERMTPEALERMRSNPRLRPMDVSEGVQNLAVGIAKDTSQPAAQAAAVSSMRQSAATAKNAVRGTYDEAMGPPPNVYEEYQRLQQQAQAVGRGKIQPALDAAKPVDTSDVVANMDKVLKPGVQSVASPGVPFRTRLQGELSEWRQELEQNGSVLTDPNRLHEVQADLRRYADDLSKSPDGQSKRLGRQLMGFRNQLVDAIDKSAPGYKDALSEYKDAKDIGSAFDFGRSLTKNTGDIETDPSYWAQWAKDKNRSPEELAAAKLGARQAIEQKMGSIKSSALDPARSGTDIPQVDFSRQKIETLFGKEDTEKMFRHLQDERDIAVSNSRGLANSTTAEAQAAQAALKPREITPPSHALPAWATMAGVGAGAMINPTVGAMVGGGMLGLSGVKSTVQYVGHRMDLARNASLAQLISRNDPQTIDQLAAAMTRIQSRNRSNKLGNLLAPP